MILEPYQEVTTIITNYSNYYRGVKLSIIKSGIILDDGSHHMCEITWNSEALWCTRSWDSGERWMDSQSLSRTEKHNVQ